MEAATQTATLRVPVGVPLGAASGDLAGQARARVAAHRSAQLGAQRRGFVLRRMLLAGDVMALFLAQAVRMGLNGLVGRPVVDLTDLALFAVFVPVFVVVATMARLYHSADRRIDSSASDELVPLFLAATVWSWFLLVGTAGVSSGVIPVLGSLTLWAATLVTVPIFRAGVRRFASTRAWYRQSVLLIGSDADLDRLRTRIARHPEWGLTTTAELPVSTSHDLNGRIERELGIVPLRKIGVAERELPDPEGLMAMVHELGIERVIIGCWPGDMASRTELIRGLVADGLHVDLVSGDSELLNSGGVLHHVEGVPMLNLGRPQITPASRLLKRTLDVAISGGALLLLAPLLGYLALRIRFDSKGPVFFRQARGGRDGEIFHVLKFRSMGVDADARRDELRHLSVNGADGLFKIRDDPRVTKFGAWMRRRSLDELPQLINVFKGEMSLVGPRPLPLDEVDLVDSHREVRESVRPGITGHWQTLGRSEIPFEDMVRLDYAYVSNWTLIEDLRILMKTAGVVVQSGQGAY
ncbi:MAG: hypothetical protein QOJ38_699 [Solirubrobacterales bacterium]|jgi:exopolysaccharide biosynthesis polyprenyl glycosylphosphotransferase|nr:hypothetical protein [Solirubrobacterales bacterium]